MEVAVAATRAVTRPVAQRMKVVAAVAAVHRAEIAATTKLLKPIPVVEKGSFAVAVSALTKNLRGLAGFSPAINIP